MNERDEKDGDWVCEERHFGNELLLWEGKGIQEWDLRWKCQESYRCSYDGNDNTRPERKCGNREWLFRCVRIHTYLVATVRWR